VLEQKKTDTNLMLSS